MAIVWGGFTNHLRIGIDCWTDGYDTYTPSINVYVDVYVQCDSSFNFDDDQTAVLSGSAGGSWTFHNGLQANQSVFVGRAVIGGQGQSYGGGPTYNFSAVLNGVYLGAGPSVSRSFTLPPRPIRPPAPPSSNPAFSSITATSAVVSWGGTSDAGGSGPDADQLQVSANSGFTAIVHDSTQGGSSRTVSGLAPGTTYWARSRIHNAAGWSGWSGTTSFTTQSFQVAQPTITNLAPDSLTLNWATPSGGTPTGYQIQRSTSSDFTANLTTITSTSWATSKEITGLSPATTYWFRVRANTASGYGAWSPAASAQTLSGAKVRQGGTWVNAVAYVRVGGAWKLAKVYKRVGGAWVL